MIQSDSTHTHTSAIPYPNTTCSPRRFDSISISVFSVNWFHVFLWSLVLFKTRSVEKHNFNWSNLSALPARSSQQPIFEFALFRFLLLAYHSSLSLTNFAQHSSSLQLLSTQLSLLHFSNCSLITAVHSQISFLLTTARSPQQFISHKLFAILLASRVCSW